MASRHFTVYLDRQTTDHLELLAKRWRVSCNALIRGVIASFVKQHEAVVKQWPQEVLDFPGVNSTSPF